MLMRWVWPYPITNAPNYGAVSLWTRPPALCLCTGPQKVYSSSQRAQRWWWWWWCVCGVCGVRGVCGSDDSGNGVSIQARSYLQLIQRQHKVLQEAESVRDLTCSDRSLVSDKVVNQPLSEEKGKKANHPQSSTSQYPEVLTFSIV